MSVRTESSNALAAGVDRLCDVSRWAVRETEGGPQFVRPTIGSPRAVSSEAPKRSGSRVVDHALGGLRPGGVTVVTSSDRFLRNAIAVDVAHAITMRPTRTVVIGSCSDDVEEVRELLVARARRQRLMCVRSGAPRSARDLRRGRDERYPLLMRRVHDASAAELKGVDAVVVSDADGGVRDGESELARWRSIAATHGIAVVVCVSGAARGWDDPRDAHLDAFRTQMGRCFTRFIARGVAPESASGPRFHLALCLGLGTMRVSAGPFTSTSSHPPRLSWAPEADFDGRWLARPTVLTPPQLAAKVTDPAWRPTDVVEAEIVRDALVAALVMGALADRAPLTDAHDLMRTAVRCGGVVAWNVSVIQAVQELDPPVARRVLAAGLRLVELPDLAASIEQ